MEEQWKDVVGFEGEYEVSNLGRVRSLDRVIPFGTSFTKEVKGKLLVPQKTGRDREYLKVALGKTGHRQNLVHRLVLEAFVGPCPEGMETCHGNGVGSDNRLENLRWDTSEENSADIEKHGRITGARGYNHGSAKLETGDIEQIFLLYMSDLKDKEIAEKLNISIDIVGGVISGRTYKSETQKFDKLKRSGRKEMVKNEINNNKNFNAKEIAGKCDVSASYVYLVRSELNGI